jgi:hypothetical protein
MLELVRESQNAYDERAVRVDWRGQKLGYVPRMENTTVDQMTIALSHCGCESSN